MECVICCGSDGDLRVVNKGIAKIIEYSLIKDDDVCKRAENNEVVFIHEQCRKTYTRRPPVKKNEATQCAAKIPRSDSFNFKNHCLFCGEIATFDTKNPNQNISKVRTLCILETIKTHAIVRDDEWGREVSLRLSGVIDLVADEGRYHRNCYQYFLRPDLNIPGTVKKCAGRPVRNDTNETFMKLCDYIQENEECQFSLNDLADVMKRLDATTEPYSEKHLKRRLKEFYGDAVVFTEIPGLSSVVCFSGYRDKTLTEKWYKEKKTDQTDERNRIVLMAAKIIREDIRSRAYNCEIYPTAEDISSGGSDLMPETLSLLINEIVLPKNLHENEQAYRRKSLTIQHCIVAAARPRSFVSPIQIGLSIHLHRQFGSKLLIDILSNLGVCSTYKETMKYEASASVNSSTCIEKPTYVQYIFDNADHNIRTLDGYGSFHVMGGIQTVTPHSTLQNRNPVPRNVHATTLSAVGSLAYLPMVWYKQPSVVGFSQITAIDLSNLSVHLEPNSGQHMRLLDVLWAIVFTSDSTVSKPNWNGFMEAAHKHLRHDKSALVPLPFINHDPNNQSTIYTALVYAAKESEKLQQKKVFVTFDQPLCNKAFDILLAASPDSVLSRVEVRIGGFHLLMSFLGAIGKVMGGSGLEDMWNTIYAKNTVVHMLSGRQYSRALRAHILTLQALLSIIFQMCPEQHIIHNLEDTFSDIFDGSLLPEDVTECRDVQAIFEIIDSKLKELSIESRTARLWAQYIEMLEIVLLYIRAERVGDWNLHLFCVQSMLPYFHAAGHLNYAKTAHIYLQRMLSLRESLPIEELEKFVGKSYFTIKRTDKFWSGTWTDMVIEQYLMRSMKSTGGLTHGRGLSNPTLSKWIRAMPATVEVVDALEKVAGVYSATTYQHVELRESRKTRDKNDALGLQDWLKLHNPFETGSSSLVCVTNGLIASSTVNCDSAKDVGIRAMKAMVGKQFSDITLKRKNVVTTLSKANLGIQVREHLVEVNPTQLFHRMLCVVRSDEELEANLSYELTAWPPALFETCNMRKGSGKAALLPVLENHLKPSPHLPNESMDTAYVIDGGYLLHLCSWQRHETYGEIVTKYVSYVTSRYTSTDVTVVFDGYGKPSTKDHEHFLRGCSSEVLVTENSFAVLPPEVFLSNASNKTQLISLLSTHLQKFAVHVIQAEADADTLLVLNAVSKGKLGKTSILVGEDTDLLVLLVAHSEGNTYMLVPSKGKRIRKVFNITLLQEALGSMKEYILFIHAFTGCDTTSSLRGKGKSLPFAKLKRDEALKNKVAIFNDKSSSPQKVAEAGEAFMCVIYGGKPSERINKLRYKLYLKTVAKQRVNSTFRMSVLPPTSEATKQHSYRVFHQIQEWNNCAMEPTLWGWKFENGQYTPIPTLFEPAPQKLLCLVSCNCKTGCDRRSCECLRNCLKCSDMCGYCSGFGCFNRLPPIEDEVEDLQHSSSDPAQNP